jgi:hypothetical protein
VKTPDGTSIRDASESEVQISASVLDETAAWCASHGLRAWDQGVFAYPNGRGIRRLWEWHASGSLYLIWVDGVAVGTFSLLTRDNTFWPQAPDDALYLHQFGVRRHASGIGHFAIRWMRDEAQRRGRKYLRLDCLGDNPAIRRYYEAAGFAHRGDLVIDEISYALYEMTIDGPLASPAQPVIDAVDRTLALAQTWLTWDGRPRVSEDGERIYTPHKAIRRVTDHLIDHLAEAEALLAGAESIPDQWHGSFVTLASDWAAFTEADLSEARQRLLRLASLYALRYAAVPPDEWDRPRGEHLTLRQIAEHVGSSWYAEQVGDLTASSLQQHADPGH